MPTARPVSRRRWLTATGLAAASLIQPGRAADANTPAPWNVDPAEVWTPRFVGWGTSLAWWARVVGAFPDEIQSDLLARVFGANDGLQLNIVRYNIGGGENPQHKFLSYRAAVEGYRTRDGQWNWAADANQRKVMLKARELGANFFEAFSNSPPWWMTKSGSVTGDREGRGNLPDEQIAPFTEYLAKVAVQFRDKAGLEFDTLTPLNEPLGSWWKFGNRQEGCVIPPAQQAKLLPATRTALDRHGLRSRVTGPETNRVTHALRALAGWRRDTWESVSHLNTHTYHAEKCGDLLSLATKHDKDIWVSEYGDGDGSGRKLARRIITDLRELRARAWIYWQAMDQRGWGLISHSAFGDRKRPPTEEEMSRFSFPNKFHVMRQFTTHLRPGCRIVASSIPNSLAGFDPRTRALSLIILNEETKPMPLALELANGTLRGKLLSGSLLKDGRFTPVPPVTCNAPTQPITIPPSTLAALVVNSA